MPVLDVTREHSTLPSCVWHPLLLLQLVPVCDLAARRGLHLAPVVTRRARAVSAELQPPDHLQRRNLVNIRR